MPPDGASPTTVLARSVGAHRVACIDGPAHAQEMVHAGAALVAAALDCGLAASLAAIFTRAGVVCEISDDPVGVELAGVAKNAAALAAGATEAQGLNAAGAAAGHIFAEVWRYAEASGARTGVLHRPRRRGRPRRHGARAAAAKPPCRRAAGAQGCPPPRSERQVAQAVEALESVRLLAARSSAPATGPRLPAGSRA